MGWASNSDVRHQSVSVMNLCRLCHQNDSLQDSHIVPRFVSKWLLESSPTRGLRDLATPNRRRQDLPTLPFLCSECEQLLSRWESEFAAKLFLPLHRNEGTTFRYGSWGMKFAASVVWRVLSQSLEHGLGRFTPEQYRVSMVAEKAWRAFLHGTVRHPGQFEVHAIPLDVVSLPAGSDVSPFLNRYLIRAIDAEAVSRQDEVLVYAKLCRILIIGHVMVPEQRRWRPSRLCVESGRFGGTVDYYLPAGLQSYMNQRAMQGAEAAASQSPRQKAKIHGRMKSDIQRVANSEVFRAMRADVAISGSDAFAVTGDRSDSAAATITNTALESHDA
jgi:hypothetical protein